MSLILQLNLSGKFKLEKVEIAEKLNGKFNLIMSQKYLPKVPPMGSFIHEYEKVVDFFKRMFLFQYAQKKSRQASDGIRFNFIFSSILIYEDFSNSKLTIGKDIGYHCEFKKKMLKWESFRRF